MTASDALCTPIWSRLSRICLHLLTRRVPPWTLVPFPLTSSDGARVCDRTTCLAMMTGSRYLLRSLRLRQAFLDRCLPGAPAHRLQQTARRTENRATRYAALLQQSLVCVCARTTCLVTADGSDGSVSRSTRPFGHALRIRLHLSARRKKCKNYKLGMATISPLARLFLFYLQSQGQD